MTSPRESKPINHHLDPVISLKMSTIGLAMGKAESTLLKIFHLISIQGKLSFAQDHQDQGKTTLLTMLGGLRSCMDGSLKILGEELRGASKGQLSKLRLNVGFYLSGPQFNDVYECQKKRAFSSRTS